MTDYSRYERQYFRHLCDMHIDDWDPVFLSRFSPENYVEMIKKGHFQNAMLYYHSHIGLCYYPSEIAEVHAAFKERPWLMRQTEELCHANGISVTGYYSLIFNTREAQKHTDWEMRFDNGKTALERGSRYGKCCPNNAEYRALVFAQIKEMLNYFKPDGMFYDMPYWPQMCYCAACKRRWETEYGGDMPILQSDPRMRLFKDARMKWMTEFIKAVADATRAIRSDIVLEFNYAYSAKPQEERGMCEEIGRSGDFVGGDIHGSLALQSFTCKYFSAVTKYTPFEYMFSRCIPDLRNHTMLKSEPRILRSVLLTLAHRGATLFIDAIDPIGTLDERVYNRFGKIAQICKPYTKHLAGEPVGDIGIVYLQNCKEYPYNNAHSHYNTVLNMAQTFFGAHIPYRVIPGCRFDKLGDYKIVILSQAAYLNTHQIEALKQYVWEGGNLYISGCGVKELLDLFKAAEFIKQSEDSYTYISPTIKTDTVLDEYTGDYPLPIDMAVPMVKGSAQQIVATLTLPYQSEVPGRFASIHSSPPGFKTDYAAIMLNKYGSGKVLWSCAPIESFDFWDYRRCFTGLLKYAFGEFMTITTDAPQDVEIILLKDNESKSFFISIIDTAELDEYRVLPGFTLSVPIDGQVISVKRLADNTNYPFEYSNGKISFELKELKMFEMFKIQL